MAEGGSSPIGDPGGLHLYNMNGGSHKMAELVAESPGRGHMVNCLPSPDHSLFGRQGGDNNHFTMPDCRSMLGGGSEYIQIDPHPSGYPKIEHFEDLKAQPPSVSHQHYFGHMDEVLHPMNSMYDMNIGGFTSQPIDMYKMNTDGQSGYINMLGNSDMSESNMFVKKEKVEFDERQLHLPQHPDMIYPPNTSIADWQYFNAVNQTSSSNGLGLQPEYQMYSSQANLAYHGGHMFNNHAVQTPMLPSNIDIHNQSKKITESIMNSTEWGSETMYKSKVYSSLATDSVFGRKRRYTEADTSPKKNSKSRKKKSADLAGHSKTAASILLSNSPPVLRDLENNGTQHKNKDVLDSSARNSLVSSLMSNLRSTVQYESFCLSFPRPQQKETAFKNKVLSTACLINSLENNTNITSKPFPSKYIQCASKMITTFQRAVKNTFRETNAKVAGCACSARNLSADQVEEHLPHSMVWVVKLGTDLLTSCWEGQFVVTVNPILSLLSFSVFQFQPQFSAESVKCLHHSKLTKELARDIIENMQQFEVSRQLRFDFSLDKVTQLCLYMPYEEESEACLLVSFSEEPLFFQRWLHTSAEEKNKWQKRSNFLSTTPLEGQVTLAIGGFASELNEVVALMLACNNELASLFENGSKVPFDFRSSHNSMQPRISDVCLNNGNTCVNDDCKSVVNDGCLAMSQCNDLRGELLNVLMHHGIVTEEERDVIVGFGANQVKNPKLTNSTLGILQDKKMCSCFRDYVNFKCKSAIELNELLNRKVSPNMHGFFESDFDMDLVPGGDIHELTVGELISSRCSNIVYFSFCSKEIGQLGHDQHCCKCHQCTTWQYWHCDVCNRCSDSRLICEYSGHVRDDQSRVIIKPLSVLKAQRASGTIPLDDIKPQWEESLSMDAESVISWPLPYDQVENNAQKMDYNVRNAMVDQLGLLNPVGFLLGQSASGACRKHRRRLDQVVKNSSQSKEVGLGSSCSLQ